MSFHNLRAGLIRSQLENKEKYGDMKADIVLKGADLINVETREIYRADVAIASGFIIKIGDCTQVTGENTKCMDVSGKVLAPGFINSGVNLFRSRLAPEGYAADTVKMGVTCSMLDMRPFEKLAGANGIEELISRTKELPADFFKLKVNSGWEFSSTKDESLKTLREGKYLVIREDSFHHDFEDCIRLIKEEGIDSRRMILAAPGLNLMSLSQGKGLSDIVGKAIKHQIDPVEAIQMITMNPAACFGLKERGSLNVGKMADIVIIDDLHTMKIDCVIKNGKRVTKGQDDRGKLQETVYDVCMLNYPKINLEWGRESEDRKFSDRIRIYRDDTLLLCKNGAVAISEGQSILVYGNNQKDVIMAVNRLSETCGGICAIQDEKLVADVELQVCGCLANKAASCDLLNKISQFEKKFEQTFHISYNFVMKRIRKGDEINGSIRDS